MLKKENKEIMEAVAEFRAAVAEGREIVADMAAMYKKLSEMQAKLAIDIEEFNRAHGITRSKKTSKRAALTIIKNEPKDPAAGPSA